MNLESIRRWQIVQAELSIRAIESILMTVDAAVFTTYRDGGKGWTVTQVLGHLYDFESVFHERAVLTVEQENPPLPFPDPDELAVQRDYNGIQWRDLLEGWKSRREEALAYFKARDESDWERIAQHPTRGAFTLHDQLFLNSLHDTLHTEQIARILAEKKVS